MPEIRPFRGLLFDPDVAGPLDEVTAPPYDVITSTDQERLHRTSPYNVVRLIRGAKTPHDDAQHNQYTRAASSLGEWRAGGVLVATDRPSVYPYEMRFHLHGAHRRVRGMIAAVALEPFGGSIVPHERTLPGPIADRLALLQAVRTNLSPVYAVFAGPSPETARFLDAACSGPPDREVIDETGTIHRLWQVAEGFDAVAAALRAEHLLIADGHHRYSVALAYRERMRAGSGPGPWDQMMMFVVDAALEDPPVLPIHRVALLPEGAPIPRGERVLDLAEVLASIDDDAVTVGVVDGADGAIVHEVAGLGGTPPTVCALHRDVIDRLPEDSRRGLRYVPDAAAAEGLVRAGTAGGGPSGPSPSPTAGRSPDRGAGPTGFILPPTRVERVWAVVRSGGMLPEKSTYFWPKPRSGVVMRPLE